MIDRLINGICRVFSVLMVVCLSVMVVMVFGNVVLRYGFNSGITVTEELSRWLFVWMTFLGAFTALQARKHLGTDLLVSRLSLVGKKICFLVSRLLMLGLSCLLVMGAWEQMLINADAKSAVMEASTAIFYASGVVFGGLAAVVLFHELWALFTGRLSEQALLGLRESEDEPAAESTAHRDGNNT